MTRNEHLNKIASLYDSFAEFEKRRPSVGSNKFEFIGNKLLITRMFANRTDLEVLDVGGGVGNYSLWLAKKVKRVKVVDISKRSLVFCEYLAKNACLENIETDVSSSDNLCFEKSESYDVILMLGPLYHANDISIIRNSILEAYRVLKKKGQLFLNFANPIICLREILSEECNISYFLSKLKELNKTGYCKISNKDKLESVIFTKSYIEKLLKITSFKIEYCIGSFAALSNFQKKEFSGFPSLSSENKSLVEEIFNESLQASDQDLMKDSKLINLIIKKHGKRV